ncbi:hypothetical protein CGRA01v4_05289 [Colletotrichum graminicola]|nr:hypothetical protein CGRA01v4_05289 [Colletotrichum graminicola]
MLPHTKRFPKQRTPSRPESLRDYHGPCHPDEGEKEKRRNKKNTDVSESTEIPCPMSWSCIFAHFDGTTPPRGGHREYHGYPVSCDHSKPTNGEGKKKKGVKTRDLSHVYSTK